MSSGEVTQAFSTQCFDSQPLEMITIDIAYGVRSGLSASDTPAETFTLSLSDNAGSGMATSLVTWQPVAMVGNRTASLQFALPPDVFVGGCGHGIVAWTLQCAACNSALFYDTAPHIVACQLPIQHMESDGFEMQYDGQSLSGYFASFTLNATETFTCPLGGMFVVYLHMAIHRVLVLQKRAPLSRSAAALHPPSIQPGAQLPLRLSSRLLTRLQLRPLRARVRHQP